MATYQGYDQNSLAGQRAIAEGRASPDGSSTTSFSTLAEEMDRVAAQDIDLQLQQGEIERQYYDRVNQFLRGELFEVPAGTLEALNSSIEAAYGPEFAALQARGIELSSLIQEQGVQALNDLREIRARSDRAFQLFTEEERQNLLDTAAASGRGPTDPQLLREFAGTLGKEFSAQQAGLTEAERGIGNLTRQQLLTLARTQGGQGGVLEAQKAATKAAQKFSLQTGLPAQIQVGAQSAQLASALDYQNLLNNSAIQGMIQGQTSPLTQERFAQPTTTQKTGFSILDALGGVLAGAGKIVGAS